MTQLGNRWLEPAIYDKIAQWYWCGVMGELYGGAIETRIANDLEDLLNWINQADAPEPRTVVASGFQASRLDTLRTRTSAAYRGLYVLLQHEGSKDFFWKARIKELDYDDCLIDIHHIFPRAWCRENGISDKVANSIVNKTAISYKANRMIGGKAPSQYLEQLKNHAQVGITREQQDEILQTHLIEPSLLRTDDFARFYERRKQDLIKVVERATGKTVMATSFEAPAEDEIEDEPAESSEIGK
jgi:hypothetical protein